MAHVLKCKGASVYSLAVTDKYIICGTYENTVQVGYHSGLLQWALIAGSYYSGVLQWAITVGSYSGLLQRALTAGSYSGLLQRALTAGSYSGLLQRALTAGSYSGLLQRALTVDVKYGSIARCQFSVAGLGCPHSTGQGNSNRFSCLCKQLSSSRSISANIVVIYCFRSRGDSVCSGSTQSPRQGPTVQCLVRQDNQSKILYTCTHTSNFLQKQEERGPYNIHSIRHTFSPSPSPSPSPLPLPLLLPPHCFSVLPHRYGIWS